MNDRSVISSRRTEDGPCLVLISISRGTDLRRAGAAGNPRSMRSGQSRPEVLNLLTALGPVSTSPGWRGRDGAADWRRSRSAFYGNTIKRERDMRAFEIGGLFAVDPGRGRWRWRGPRRSRSATSATETAPTGRCAEIRLRPELAPDIPNMPSATACTLMASRSTSARSR
jgi:hypothetical protein